MHTLHDVAAREFGSDNYSGVHPEIMTAIVAANEGHVPGYGDDPYTEHLAEVVTTHFGEGARAFPVFNGTGANVIALQTLLPRWGSVITAETAHINVDEGGAPEQRGIKIHTVPAPDGKLTPELIDLQAWGWDDEHRSQPLAVSITQSTELGTLYTPDEVRAIADHVHGLGMRLHMDGSRIANAAAALDVPLRAFTRDAGVDVLSLGGTKNGALAAEAVVVFDDADAKVLPYIRKGSMQLASKMRFVSAQLIALYGDDLWLRNARHANAMAARLRAGIEHGLADGAIRGVAFTQPTQANGVFATLPEGVADRLRTRFRFYDWDATIGEVRWLCTFDTTEDDVDAFLAAIAEETTRA